MNEKAVSEIFKKMTKPLVKALLDLGIKEIDYDENRIHCHHMGNHITIEFKKQKDGTRKGSKNSAKDLGRTKTPFSKDRDRWIAKAKESGGKGH